MQKVAVVLAGCGVYDGSEIHEATLVLLHLARAGVPYVCLAPNVVQAHVVDHQKGTPAEADMRNVMSESARIARGPVEDIGKANPSDYLAVIYPGGFGAAKNLSNFAFEDDAEKLVCHPDVAHFVRNAHDAGIPQGFICISPASVAAIALRGRNVLLTIGNDEDTAARIQALGHRHEICPVDGAVVDEANNIVSTPAYMLAQNPAEADEGIAKLVTEVLKLANKAQARAAGE